MTKVTSLRHCTSWCLRYRFAAPSVSAPVPEGAMATKKNKIYQRCKATQSEEYNVISKGLVLMQVTFLNPEASGRDDDVLKY